MSTVYNKLPIAYRYNGVDCEYFQTRELSMAELKQLQDRKAKINNPVLWVAKACCLIVEELGGVKVYEQYMTTKVIPEVIKKMPMVCSTNILVAGHIETLDHKIVDFPMDCPRCGHENEVNFDLLSLDVPTLDLTYEDLIVDVELSHGHFVDATLANNNGMDPTVPFKKLKLRLPRTEDVLELEHEFNLSANSLFLEKLIGKCIIEMEAEDGALYPSDVLERQKVGIITKLKPKDVQAIVRAQNKAFPKLDISSQSVCEKCSNDIKYEIDSSFLFLMV